MCSQRGIQLVLGIGTTHNSKETRKQTCSSVSNGLGEWRRTDLVRDGWMVKQSSTFQLEHSTSTMDKNSGQNWVVMDRTLDSSMPTFTYATFDYKPHIRNLAPSDYTQVILVCRWQVLFIIIETAEGSTLENWQYIDVLERTRLRYCRRTTVWRWPYLLCTWFRSTEPSTWHWSLFQ